VGYGRLVNIPDVFVIDDEFDVVTEAHPGLSFKMWPRAPRISTNISTCSEDVAFTYRITHTHHTQVS
jgi:hypothetical protein